MAPSPYRDEAVWNGSGYYSQAQHAGRRQGATLYESAKRTLDIVGSLIGLLLFSPLIVLVAVLIKLEEPRGPILFYQTRIGKNEKPFRMYKLRSMAVNAEERLKDLLEQNEISGAMFKMKDDPRITKVGKWIRKTSIDELPQLFNVLRGDMSLVGPRPPLLREVEEYSEYDKLRLSVTPGCTGMWQVSGRNSLTFKQMVELDIAYIQKRCLWLDIKIMLKTVKVMITPQDAF
ncbi:sugar transferase [Paenibacillus sp. J5C_2022]|uniref:sugar transferase n=1 Tax=Paenibacillus sp. J5C2022 TaxID=2977129 RepID=UPI0021CFDFE4|nr:sugar transferase [Paenibacillus sp. J5C2022]MCU6707966.1 sugar transferase [Paenibacillus sp. J5C2022]